jgi:hypothetical protein
MNTHYSVTLGAQPVGAVEISGIYPRGRFVLSKAGKKAGLIPSPSIRHDLTAAGRYLESERAAVSCVCCGYTVSRN